MPRIDPITLRVFIAVVDSGTIAAAAAQEHLVPAAISKRIRELEQQLDLQLLVRTNKGVEPTTAGMALCAYARRVLGDLEQIPAMLKGYGEGTHGVVRIHASLSATAQFLPADLSAFLKRYPHVELQMHESSSVAVTDLVAENVADIGVFTNAPPREGLLTTEYDEDRLSLCVPLSHAFAGREGIDLADALDEQLVGMPPNNAIGLLLARTAATSGKPLKVRIQVQSFEAMFAMISEGLGVGVMPDTVIRRSARAFAVTAIPLTNEWARRRFFICRRNDSHLHSPAGLLNDHLHFCAMKRRGIHT